LKFSSLALVAAMMMARMLPAAYFEPNHGQSQTGDPYLARTSGGMASIGPSSLRLHSLAGPDVEVSLEHADAHAPAFGLDPLPGVSHYALKPNPSDWIYGVPHFAGVRFERIYPGVDLRYHFSGSRIEFDFELANAASLGRIRLRFSEGVRVTEAGDLRVGIGAIHRPIAWQTIAGKRRNVDVFWRLAGGDGAGFRMGPHDPAAPVTIDPVVGFATYLGGSSAESDTRMIVDSTGNIYMAGTTYSTDFPASEPPGSVLNAPAGLREATVYVTRLAPDASTIAWSFYIGGSAWQRCAGLAQDSLGNIFLLTTTASANFPVTTGAWKKSIDSTFIDEAVVKLDAQSGHIAASTYVGLQANAGVLNTVPFAVDYAGGVYVSGLTGSAFQPTAGAWITKSNGVPGIYENFGIVRLSASLTSAVYATYIEMGVPNLLQTDLQGNLILTGSSAGSSFTPFNPIPGFSQTSGGIFAAKLNAFGSALIYASLIDGGGYDSETTDLQVDRQGNAWIAGHTAGTAFPQVNPLVLDPVPSNYPSADQTNGSPFFVEIPPTGGALVRSTLFFGPGYTTSQGQLPTSAVKLAFPSGRLCLSGTGVSSETTGALGGSSYSSTGPNPVYGTWSLNCVDEAGSQLAIRTVLPPTSGSYASMQATPDGALLFAGMAYSGFATTPGIVQAGFAGDLSPDALGALNGGDAFLLRVSLGNPVPHLTSVYPDSIFRGSANQSPNNGAYSFTLNGTGLAYGTQMTWNGQPVASTFNSPTQITVTGVTETQLQAGANQIGASLAGPGGGVSNMVTVNVYNPAPSSITISPSLLATGSPEKKIAIFGYGISPSSVLTWNGSVRSATYVAPTPPATNGYLEFLIEPAEMTQPAVIAVTLTNVGPGGGASAPARFVIQPSSGAGAPGITGPGNYAFDESTPPPGTVTLSGYGFTSASTVTWDGAAIPASFVSTNTLAITPPDGALATLGSHDLVAANGSLASGIYRFAVVRSLGNLAKTAYDPQKNLLYVLSAPQVIPLTPVTYDLAIYDARNGHKTGGMTGVITQLNALAVSDDGAYLYMAGGATAEEIKRYNAAAGSIDLDWQIQIPAAFLDPNITSLVTISGSPQSVIALVQSEYNAVSQQTVIFDNDQPRAGANSIYLNCCYNGFPFATSNRLFFASTWPCLQWRDFDAGGFEGSGSGQCGTNPPELQSSNGFFWLTDGTRTLNVATPPGLPGAPWAIDNENRVVWGGVSSANSPILEVQVNLDTLQEQMRGSLTLPYASGSPQIILARDGTPRLLTSSSLIAP
jgi:hypothetical protein